MDNMERKISDYIDSLNKEKRPKEHDPDINSEKNEEEKTSIEYEELMKTVRTVRNLKDYEEPGAKFEEKLFENISNYKKRRNKEVQSEKRKRNMNKFKFFGSIAAVLAIIFILTPFFRVKGDMVQAMEASYKELKAYHGIMEIIASNEEGEEFIQGKREVWADEEGRYIIKELEGSFEGEKTVNNGEKKWKVNPDEKEVEVYSAFPDTTPFAFEIGNEIKDVKNALKVEEVGEEEINGKAAVKLEVTPEGGESYHLWVDKKSNLPVQRQTPVQNGLQYKVAYAELESVDLIPEELIAYEIPEGFTEVDKSLEHLVASQKEAEEILKFVPILVDDMPSNFEIKSMTVDMENKIFRTYFKVKEQGEEQNKNVVFMQQKASSKLEISATSILGTVNGHKAEYIPSIKEEANFISYATQYGDTSNIGMIHWQDEEYEYGFIGDVTFEELSGLGTSLIGEEFSFKEDKEENFQPEISVNVDINVEENTQKSVDGGNSPWKLDPAYVASVESSLIISPEGIVGEYPVEYEKVSIVYNDGTKAVAEIDVEGSPVKKVYLEKIIRQDETGIWTMVGYDPAE